MLILGKLMKAIESFISKLLTNVPELSDCLVTAFHLQVQIQYRFFNPITDISSEAAVIVEITLATVNY